MIANGLVYTPINNNGLEIANGVPATRHNGLVLANGVRVAIPFVGWTELDANSKLVVPATETGLFTFSGQEKPASHTYALHPDTGAEYWNGDFEFKFRVLENNDLTAVSSRNTRLCITGGACDTGAASIGAVGGITLNFYPTNTHEDMTFQVWDYGDDLSSNTIITKTAVGYHDPATSIYVKFLRSGDNVTLTLYSGSDYLTGQITTGTVGLSKANGISLTHFYAVNTDVGPSGEVRDLDIEFDLISRG